jgi:carbon-monoxide dehydrogenase small subunit
MHEMIVAFVLNGERTTARVMAPTSLLEVLRDDLGMGGSKNACEQGECGSCSIVLDGRLVCSCLVMAVDAEGSDVRTVEGVSSGDFLHPIQDAMHRAGAVQCGFCTPGFVMAAVDLFEHNPHPTKDEIKEALAGNICRCTGYGAIIRAFEDLARDTR